ncbi:MAG: alkaline phosphatase D family protein [Deltaproteobacteria bacterium]|nr:alkaline phosphatase D family protein [Deltaproteobacteria bacterium]
MWVLSAACGGGPGQGADGGAAGDAPVGEGLPAVDADPRVFRLVSASSVSPTRVRLLFSAPLDKASAERPGAYRVAGLPLFAAVLEGDRAVRLETHYQLAGPYAVEVDDRVADTSGRRLAPGARATFESAALAVKLAPTFADGSMSALLAAGWKVVDDPRATNAAPSAWQTGGGFLRQSSDIYGGDPEDRFTPDRAGTFFVAQKEALGDALVEATLASADDDGIGLVLRFRDEKQHYRFQWFRQGGHRELVRVEAGVTTRLAFDVAPYASGTTYRVRFSVEGTQLALFLDDALVLQAQDPSPLPAGAPGCFAWGNRGLDVGKLRVAELPKDAGHAAPSVVQGPPHTGAPMAATAPAVGDPQATEVVAWARATGPAAIAWQVASSPDFKDARQTEFLPVSEADAFAASRVVSGLSPGATYYLRPLFAAGAAGGLHNVGAATRVRTPPAPEAAESVTFAFSADVGVRPDLIAQNAIFDELPQHAPLFYLNLGDFPYMDSFVKPVAVTQVDFWERHQEVRTVAPIGRLAGAMPLVAIWDDHEVRDNWDGAFSASSAGALLVTRGVKAWHDYFPFRPTAGAAPSNYRTLRLGALAELFLLDTRSFRSANAMPDGPTKTMLGAAQKAWLEKALAASTAKVKLVVSSVPLRYTITGTDAWSGFATERAELLAMLAKLGPKGALVLTGDNHRASVHHHPEGIVEVMAGPISAPAFAPPSPLPPEVVFSKAVPNYGIVRITPKGQGAEVVVELYAAGAKLLWRETL